MRRLKLSLFVAAFLYVASAAAQAELTVMSFNIRLNTAADSLNAWPYRKDLVASQVLFFEADVLGVQEALYGQMLDLQERLPHYKYVGVGRDDGKTKGEFSAIFYDTTQLRCLKSATFWLSQTPGVPGSKGWDAALPRVVTWGLFQHRQSGKQFYAFNTHFDHMGKEARSESARLLLQQVEAIAGKVPAVITGDFNASEDDPPIKIIAEQSNPLHLTDTKAVSQTPHFGPGGTFTGFGAKEVSDKAIDHIFIKNKLTVLKHATLSESWKGRFSSDHFPVLAVIRF